MTMFNIFYTRVFLETVDEPTLEDAKARADYMVMAKGPSTKLMAVIPAGQVGSQRLLPDPARLKRLLAKRVTIPPYPPGLKGPGGIDDLDI